MRLKLKRVNIHFFQGFLISFIAGLLYPLGFIPQNNFFPQSEINIFPFAILGVALFFRSLINSYKYWINRPKAARIIFIFTFFQTFLFSLGILVSGFYWLVHTISTFAGLSGLALSLSFFLFTFMVLPYFWLFFALFFGIFALDRVLVKGIYFNQDLIQVNLIQVYLKNDKMRISINIALSITFTLLEYYCPALVPIYLGHSYKVLAPYLGLVPYFGVYLYSFVSYWLILSLLNNLYCKKWDRPALGFFVLFLIFNIGMPLSSKVQDQAQDQAQKNTYRVRIVQTNVGDYTPFIKAKGQNQFLLNNLLNRLSLLSVEKTKSSSIDLVIWPESSYPIALPYETIMDFKLKNEIPTPIQLIQKKLGTEVLYGAYDAAIDPKDRALLRTNGKFEIYNSTVFINKEGEVQNVYHKQRLVPFGESLNWGFLDNYMANYIKNITFFRAGHGWVSFKTKSHLYFATALCYEILFSEDIRTMLNGDNRISFIVNLTNDFWYDNSVQPLVNLLLVSWRAMEFNLPLVRATNTGISTVIYPDGSYGAQIPFDSRGVEDYDLWPSSVPRVPTLYQKYGMASTLALMLILLLLSLLAQVRLKGRLKLRKNNLN